MAGERSDSFAIDFVSDTDLDLVDAAEHVEHHHGQAIDAAEPRSVADGDGVKPTTASRTAGGGAILATDIADALADFVKQFRGERPSTDSSRVALGDADHLGDPARRNSGAGTDTDARAVAAGDEGEGAMIDIEQGSLSSFEQELASGLAGVEQERRGVSDEGLELFAIGGVLLDDPLRIERLGQIDSTHAVDQRPFDGGDRADSLGEVVAVHVTESDRVSSAHFVSVAGTDASQGGADVVPACGGSIQSSVFGDVPRHDQVSSVADSQVAGDINTASREGGDFIQQRGRVQDHPTGDDVHHIGVENTAGNMVELVGLVTHDDRMARVGSALIAHHDFLLRGEQVDQFSLGFIAPLQTDHAKSGQGRLLVLEPRVEISWAGETAQPVGGRRSDLQPFDEQTPDSAVSSHDDFPVAKRHASLAFSVASSLAEPEARSHNPSVYGGAERGVNRCDGGGLGGEITIECHDEDHRDSQRTEASGGVQRGAVEFAEAAGSEGTRASWGFGGNR